MLEQSADIVRWASSAAPGPGESLFPVESAAAVSEHIARTDSELGPAVRRWFYAHTLWSPSATGSALTFGVPWGEQAAVALGALWPVRAVMAAGMGISAQGGREALAVVRDHFARASALLADGRPFLLGATFTAADLTFCALTAAATGIEASAASPPQSALPPALQAEMRELADTAAGRYVARVWQQERRRVVVPSPGVPPPPDG